MVHTQAQHIFLALAAIAAVAGPLSGSAAAVYGEEREIDLAVDGSVRTQLAEQVALPVEAPVPWADVGKDVAFRFRTSDMVLPNPAGTAYASLPGPLQRVAPVRVQHDGVALRVPGGGLLIPWYYMMDEATVRPYSALFWDTGTSWYAGLGDDLWSTYVPDAQGVPSSPFGYATSFAPDVWLRTAVHEIDVLASFDVILHSALAATEGAGYDRPDAPAATQATALFARTEQLAPLGPASGVVLPEAPAAPAADAAGLGAPTLRSAQAAAPSPLGAVMSLEAAAAGAAGLLAGVAAYHLIRKSAILKNKVRGSIAEHVLRQPGSTITEIAQAVGVTHQTASYHLRLLQEHGLVIGVERGNKRLYFRNDGSFNQEERGLVAVLRDPESMRVLELIRQNPWIMKNEAAAALGVSRNTLNWHLQKLLSAGLVSEARENGHCFLFCNRKAAGEVLTQVVAKVEERKGVGVPAEAMPAVLFQSAAPVQSLGDHERMSGA